MDTMLCICYQGNHGDSARAAGACYFLLTHHQSVRGGGADAVAATGWRSHLHDRLLYHWLAENYAQ